MVGFPDITALPRSSFGASSKASARATELAESVVPATKPLITLEAAGAAKPLVVLKPSNCSACATVGDPLTKVVLLTVVTPPLGVERPWKAIPLAAKTIASSTLTTASDTNTLDRLIASFLATPAETLASLNCTEGPKLTPNEDRFCKSDKLTEPESTGTDPLKSMPAALTAFTSSTDQAPLESVELTVLIPSDLARETDAGVSDAASVSLTCRVTPLTPPTKSNFPEVSAFNCAS